MEHEAYELMDGLRERVEPALSFLEAVPGSGTWERALGGIELDLRAVRAISTRLDAPIARRFLTAHVVAAELAAADTRTVVDARAFLEQIDSVLEPVGVRPASTRQLARAAAGATRSLLRLRGRSLHEVRARVWAACFGTSLYSADWFALDLRDQSVMILGETGTGKELVAQTLAHANLWRDATLEQWPSRQEKGEPRHRPAREQCLPVSFNAAALSPSNAEGELFGWEQGAFTDARTARIGLIEAGHGATIFIDEIGDMPKELHGKLLRAIAAHEITPLGSKRGAVQRVMARWISATSRDMEQLTADGRFAEDLWRRLSGLIIRMPPLRDWPLEDVRDVARHHLSLLDDVGPWAAIARCSCNGLLMPGDASCPACGQPRPPVRPSPPAPTGRNTPRHVAELRSRFDAELGAWLLETRRSWPGNVRQLRQLVNAWQLQGAAQARADLERIPVLSVHAPAALASTIAGDDAFASLDRRVQERSATIDELEAWYLALVEPQAATTTELADRLGVSYKTVGAMRSRAERVRERLGRARIGS